MAKPQIFNRDMKRLAYLDNALAVGYGLETNSLWTATFTLPADDPKNAYCTHGSFDFADRGGYDLFGDGA